MKKVINTLNIRLVFFALSVTFCAPLCGMNTLVTQLKSGLTDLKWAIKANTYTKSTIATDCTMSIVSKIGYQYLKYTQKKDPAFAKKFIEHKLTQIKNNLEQDETKAINALAKDYKITDKQQGHIKELINQYKEYGKWYMLEHWDNVNASHDESLPKEIMPILEKNKIHPSYTALAVSPTPFEHANNAACATALEFEDYDFNRIIKNQNCPTVISSHNVTIYPLYFNLSKIFQLGVLIHEVGHIANQDWTTKLCIGTAIHTLTKTPSAAILANNNYKKLYTNHERAAEILPALKFKEDASILRKVRKENYYPKQLYGKHYFQLALIDTLHTLDKNLQSKNQQ